MLRLSFRGPSAAKEPSARRPRMTAYRLAAHGDLTPSAGAMIGLPAIRLQRHSIMNERPEPFAPPSGNSVASFFGSVVSRPSASSPQPSGMSRPASRALITLPIATVEVDMSSSSGGRSAAGNAIASGLLDTPATLAP